MSLQSGAETLPVPSSTGSVPAWLHVAAAWSLALVGLIFLGILAVLKQPLPEPLVIVVSVAGGGALGLTNPLTLIR